MVNAKEKLALSLGATAIIVGIGLTFMGMTDEERSDQEMIDRLEVIEQQIAENSEKQQMAIALLSEKFDTKPPEAEPPKPTEPPKPELVMPYSEMFDCVYSYSMDLSPIDTVATPMVHNSWVLGGECEKLAHDLRDNEYPGEVWNAELAGTLELKGMCVGYTDDSPILAKKCQKNMQRWLEVFCWNTLEDNEIRACKRTHLMTSLDHDPDEKPW